jgi:methylenetetrahydrofolate reductase (NADPH)
MAELNHEVEHVGIVGYPEPHPILADAAMDQLLQAKGSFATYMVSQICFDSAKILAWINNVR